MCITKKIIRYIINMESTVVDVGGVGGGDNVCANEMFAHTTDDLLKNISFSHFKCAPFKLHHYVTLKRLSNGVIDNKSLDANAADELKKFNFKIDQSTKYISNIFEYEFVILEHDLSVVHVLDANTKIKLGHLNVSLNNNDANVLLLTTTLTA
ncbi:ORF-111 [Catopsilia pomona nucleopolyhedrovirus]|uniref:ORF-111 n=1 Tax=Catopsilia pomona nucleopolyhedrovirus TaxID=1850906 RepID=A0A172WZI5_9ABAC|nr:ORF-111 [Catopsilia pomona nucleopolyhedrovirus]ANF29759.1 ORF-111 [Catopsilia pomona nucleopolyhedrovirus]